jgi:hypothetical protein
MEGFPLELLPVNLAIQRSKGSAFTNSFVAGVYRDTRMGLEELRATRRARLKKKHDAIGAAKGAVAADIARLQALAALAAKRQVDRQRRRYEAMLFRGALVLQSVYRKRRARVRAAGPPTWHVLIIQERGLPWSERLHVDTLLVNPAPLACARCPASVGVGGAAVDPACPKPSGARDPRQRAQVFSLQVGDCLALRETPFSNGALRALSSNRLIFYQCCLQVRSARALEGWRETDERGTQ